MRAAFECNQLDLLNVDLVYILHRVLVVIKHMNFTYWLHKACISVSVLLSVILYATE